MILAILMSIYVLFSRFNDTEPNVYEKLVSTPEHLKEDKQRRLDKRYQREWDESQKQGDLEIAYTVNSNHPQWVVKVWYEQGKLNSDGSLKRIYKND